MSRQRTNSQSRNARQENETVQVQPKPHKEILQEQAHLMQTIQKTNALPTTSKNPNMLTTQRRHELGKFGGNYFSHVGQRFLPLECEYSLELSARLFCGKFSKSGDIFVSAAQDEIFRVFNSKTGKLKFDKEFSAKDVGWSVLDMDFSADQKWLVYSSWSHYIHLCDLNNPVSDYKALNLKPAIQQFCVFSLRFSPSSDEIIAGSSDCSIYVYDLNTNKRVTKIPAHENDINTVTFADDISSNVILSGSDDCLIKVWDRRSLKSNKAQGCLGGHSQGVTCVSPKGDSRYFISNGKDQTLKLWDIRKMTNSVSVPVSRDEFDYRSDTHRIAPRDIKDMSLLSFTGHSVYKTLIRCEFSPQESTGGRYVVTGSHDGYVYFFDVLTGEKLRTNCRHDSAVRDISWHPYLPVLVSSSWDGYLGVHQYENQSSITEKEKEKEKSLKREREEEQEHRPRTALARLMNHFRRQDEYDDDDDDDRNLVRSRVSQTSFTPSLIPTF